jgi:hypothetical protein
VKVSKEVNDRLVRRSPVDTIGATGFSVDFNDESGANAL